WSGSTMAKPASRSGGTQVASRPYRIRFFFDYGSGICLWAGNALTRERFGYPIEAEHLRPLAGNHG
ncbi:MAG TPA: hypothetical protein VGS80_26275, partial [Ktedonobacterales bacterium]|nr:hypothetical protein [Ktedonobacterales bacterium]